MENSRAKRLLERNDHSRRRFASADDGNSIDQLQVDQLLAQPQFTALNLDGVKDQARRPHGRKTCLPDSKRILSKLGVRSRHRQVRLSGHSVRMYWPHGELIRANPIDIAVPAMIITTVKRD
jgi:hypothetical protein